MSSKRDKQRCRLCLSMATEYTDISTCDKYNIVQKIDVMFAFKITSDDVFTTKICRKCIKEVKQLYSFFEKVKNSQLHLEEELMKMENTENLINADKDKDVYTDPCDELEQQLAQITGDSSGLSDLIYDVKIKEEHLDNNFTKDVFIGDAQFSNNDFDSEDDTKLIFFNKKSSAKIKRKEKKKNRKKLDNNCSLVESKAELENHEMLNEIRECDSFDDNISDVNIEEHDFSNVDKNTPIELFKNGKLVIKGLLLDKLMASFYKFKCTLCDPTPQFDVLDSLFKHYENEHSANGFVTCCNKKLFRRKAALEHMRKHLQPLAFQCPICKKVLSRPHLLREHLASHLPESEKPRKCNQCDRRYTCYSALRNHMLSHIPKENRDVFKCSQCDKEFSNKSGFKMHVMNVHTAPQHLCAVCGKKFKTKSSLAYHLTTHDDKMKMCCKECGFIGKNKQTLKNHLATHSNIILKCDKCEYTTLLKRSLWNHMKMRHSDDKPFQCSFCEKRFKTKKLLEFHITQHTGERKFSCKYCPKTFASSGNKSTHMKRMHTTQLEEEAKNKKQMYNSVLEVQLLQSQELERKEMKSQELARQHLKELESSFRNPILTKTEPTPYNRQCNESDLIN